MKKGLQTIVMAAAVAALGSAPVWLKYVPKEDPNAIVIPLPKITPPQKPTEPKSEVPKEIPCEGDIPYAFYREWSGLFPIKNATVALLDDGDYGISRIEEVIRDTEKYPRAARDYLKGELSTYAEWRKHPAVKEEIRAQLKHELGARQYGEFMDHVKKGLHFTFSPINAEHEMLRVKGWGVRSRRWISPTTRREEIAQMDITPYEFEFLFFIKNKKELTDTHYRETRFGESMPDSYTEFVVHQDEKMRTISTRSHKEFIGQGNIYTIKSIGRECSLFDIFEGIQGSLEEEYKK